MTRRRNSDDLPIVIKEAGKAVDRDIKPTLDLLGRFFLGGAMPRRPEPEPVTYEPAKPSPVRLPSSQQIVVSASRGRDDDPHIIDAEIIEEESGIPQICPT